MAHGAPELFESDVLSGDRLHHVGPGDEHVRRALDHEDEIRHGRGVDGAPGARSENDADLGNDTRRGHVTVEDPTVGVEGDHPFLNARPGAVVEPDHRHAGRGGQIHHLVDLLGEHLAQRTAEHGEVLAEHTDAPAVDGAESGDHAIGVRAVVLQAHTVGPVAGQHVQLLERTLVEEVVDAFPGGHLALGVVLLHRAGGPGIAGHFAALGQFLESLGHRVIHGQ
jgi:hypothetical protein